MINIIIVPNGALSSINRNELHRAHLVAEEVGDSYNIVKSRATNTTGVVSQKELLDLIEIHIGK